MSSELCVMLEMLQHMNAPVQMAESISEHLLQFPGENHESLHEGCEHDESERDPDQRVHDTEHLAAL